MSNTKTSSSLKTLCRTAIFLALLIAVQFVTRSIGQYVTGSLVNLILIASGLMCGLWGGLAVAVLSPICAFFIGIGPAFPQVVPAVALGNAVLVLLWVLIAGAKNGWCPWCLPLMRSRPQCFPPAFPSRSLLPQLSAVCWLCCWCRLCAARLKIDT